MKLCKGPARIRRGDHENNEECSSEAETVEAMSWDKRKDLVGKE